MNKPLPFFNWSLKKALESEPDSFNKARIRIIFTILLFSLLKILVVAGYGIANEQWLQVTRIVIAFVVYLALVKILLYVPSRLKLLAHIMLQLGVILVWSNISIYSHNINLATLQFVFMIMLSSFYTLGSLWGFIYSILGCIPVFSYLIFGNSAGMFLTEHTQVLASPGLEIIVTLNFLSIIIAHYLFFQAFHTNIREKEKLNSQLQLSITEANKLAASKSNFLSTMSHELRTPLNSVVGITELLLEDSPDERQKENLKILQFSTLDLLSLINNVLDFNKIDSDKLVLESVPFPLAEHMQNICSVLRVKANDKQLDFILDIDEKLSKTIVISDPTRLSQLIYNLVGNAIKFTDKGSITVKLELTGGTDQSADVLFSIKDTGIGIPADKHEKIFEQFTQAASDTTRKYGGTGLGLAIVRQILALFNSSIYLESTPGKGSRFFFTLPFATAGEEVKIQRVSAAGHADLSHLKILIAEDNEINRVIMRKQLEKLNIQALIVEDGKQAYEACAAGYYDAIFMDLHMPVMDGHEATMKIRALQDPVKANIYIIAFTASVTEQEQIFHSGFDDFLYKPVNMRDLRDKLEKIAAREKVQAS